MVFNFTTFIDNINIDDTYILLNNQYRNIAKI